MKLITQTTAACPGQIDWARLAFPQTDGYDTEVIAQVAARRGSVLRPRPWSRRSTEGAEKTLFGGRVAIRNRNGQDGGLPWPRYVPAKPVTPSLDDAEVILRNWPAVALQFPHLVDTIQVWNDSTVTSDNYGYISSSSHSLEEEFGTIMLTVDHPFGIAQTMVHEMAHHKLRALGISLLEANHLILNDPRELYASPIILTKKRPMTAVFHAQYSFIHVSALNNFVYMNTFSSSELNDQAKKLLERNIPRMEAGYQEIERNLITDKSGAIFCGAFMDWSRDVIRAGKAILSLVR